MGWRGLWRAGAVVGGAALALAGAGPSALPAAAGGASLTGDIGADLSLSGSPALARSGPFQTTSPRPATPQAALLWRAAMPLPATAGAALERAWPRNRSHRAVAQPRIRSPDRRDS